MRTGRRWSAFPLLVRILRPGIHHRVERIVSDAGAAAFATEHLVAVESGAAAAIAGGVAEIPLALLLRSALIAASLIVLHDGGLSLICARRRNAGASTVRLETGWAERAFPGAIN
jgi:hypothetical protein